VATRELTEPERRLLEFLLTEPFEGREALGEQAKSVVTEGLSCGCGCPSISLSPDRQLHPATVLDRVPVEAHGFDPERNLVGVLLFVDDGYMSELEVYSYEGDFGGVPDPADLQISRWSDTEADGVGWLLNPPAEDAEQPESAL
jgi:hypothetical protein